MEMNAWRICAIILAVVSCQAAAIAGGGPESDSNDLYWDDQFPASGLGVSGTPYAMVKDASGNLYVGGAFAAAGNVAVSNIAKWDRVSGTWSALGGGVNGSVNALVVDTHGNVYAGGNFTKAGELTVNHVARWDGTAWSALGGGTNRWVLSLLLDASGSLYVGGNFTSAGDTAANGIAKWNGTSWSTFGLGLRNKPGSLLESFPGEVRALASDASGNIYVGGRFGTAGTVDAHSIAKLSGGTWSALGSGLSGFLVASVNSIVIGGTGTVYAGGDFTGAGGYSTNGAASWNGSAWSTMAGGPGGAVNALVLDASGALYAGGSFKGSTKGTRVSRWTGTAWTAVGDGADDTVYCMAADGSGKIYAGGAQFASGSVPVNHLSYWDGANWSALGVAAGFTGTVTAVAADGQGNVYAGGAFVPVHDGFANRVAKWNGSAWSALGSGISGKIDALVTDDAGNLYAGGSFAAAGGVTAANLAKWDGGLWSPLGSGTNGEVYAIALDDFGSLYAGGSFSTAGGVTVSGVAMWDGAAWHAVGTNFSSSVLALATDPHGNLYAGGSFNTVDGVTVNYVAKWDGTAWSPLGTGLGGSVYALALDNSGNLYAGGTFSAAGGSPASYVAKWDGVQWSPLSTGAGNYVRALALDRSGTLYAGGDFTSAGGVVVNRLAKWDGANWLPLASGTNGMVNALTVRDNTLFAGGAFRTAGNKTSGSFAVWQPRVDHGEAVLDAMPGAMTVGGSAYGYCKSALVTEADTTVTFEDGLPVTVTLDRADEIEVGGVRVNGATALAPSGVQFGGGGALLRVEFSQDDADAYGVDYTEFRAVKMTYRPDYPVVKEAKGLSGAGAAVPVPVGVENGVQMYAVMVAEPETGSVYGAVPRSLLSFRAPSKPAAGAIGADTITWSWQDNSENETGFNLWITPGTSAPVTLATTTAADVTSFTQVGLAANTAYSFQVEGVNPDGSSLKSTQCTAWTKAMTPTACLVGGAVENSLTVAVGGGDGNPTGTEYAIASTTTGQWVQADGTLGSAPVWRTAADWGTIRVTGLASNALQTFAVTARSGAGVLTEAGPSASATTLETTIPTGTIMINGGAAYIRESEVTLTLTASDGGGSGVTAMRLITTNGQWQPWEPFVTSRVFSLALGEGYVHAAVQYRDAVGNVSTDEIRDITMRDTTPPTGSIYITGGPVFTGVTTTTLNLYATDLFSNGTDGSGVTEMRFNKDASHWDEWKPYSLHAPFTVQGEDGVKGIWVQYRDAAGNESQPYAASCQLLAGVPTGSIVINGNAATTTSPNVTLGLAWTGGGGTGVNAMRFSDDGAHWTYWEPAASTKAHTLPGANGYKTVRVQFRDDTGKTSIAYSDYIQLVSKAPLGSIKINDDTHLTNSRDVTLSLTWAKGGDGWPVNQMRFSDDGAHWSAWEAVASTKKHTLPGLDGYNTVRVQFRDWIGNVSERYSDYILLDTTKPTGAIIINDGATRTGAALVTLSLTYSDGTGGSGVSLMRFSDDGATWTAWEPVAATATHALYGPNGYKTVRVQYRDMAGNYSDRISDYILLDTK